MPETRRFRITCNQCDWEFTSSSRKAAEHALARASSAICDGAHRFSVEVWRDQGWQEVTDVRSDA